VDLIFKSTTIHSISELTGHPALPIAPDFEHSSIKAHKMQQLTKFLSFSIYPIRICIFALAFAMVSCGGDGGGPAPTYTVGGTVSGLTSGSLVLKNNNGDELTISANTPSFTFATALTSGAAYAVTAGARPSR
jgi:hypothetical protein